jgi:hypothetical protein
MPNWCNNQLVVTGVSHRIENFSQLEEFRAQSSDPQSLLVFSKLVPEPGKPDDADYDWYSWRVENWGSKWEPDCQDRQEEEGALRYLFQTAWSPPEAWVLKVSEMFPALEFEIEYDEPGMGYAGRSVFRGGTQIEEVEIDIKEIYPDWDWDQEEE